MSKAKSRKLSHATPDTGLGQGPLDRNNNPSSSKKCKDYEKYSLRPRSIQNRIETEKRQKGEAKKEPKPKQKPPPLSKYRRKTANARERVRMLEINTAYELLQKAVPQYPILPMNSQGKTCEKLTKITTLRLAMNYIQSMQSLLNQSTNGTTSAPGLSLNNDIESDTDSIGNSIASSTSYANSSSGSIGSNSSGAEFSPASSYAMSPMSSSSPVGPDCIQTVMRSVVSPAAAAAISANAANLNHLNLNNVSLSSLTSSPASLGIVAPHQSITTIVTIPSHPHAQAQYSRQLPPTIHHHHQHQQIHQLHNQTHHHHGTLAPPHRPPAVTSSSSSSSSSVYMTPSAMNSSGIELLLDPQQKVSVPPSPQFHTMSTMPTVSISHPQQQISPLLCSPPPPPSPSVVVSSHSYTHPTHHHLHHQLGGANQKTKLPPIATTLTSALLRKSMSSFLTDCIQLTNGVSVSTNTIIGNHTNNGTRTGSLSSLTESDLSEYTNDLLSDEGSVLDEPIMFEDIIGVGATDLELLLGTDSENLGFSSDLSNECKMMTF